MKLRYKLLAAFLLTSLLIVGLTGGIMHFTVKRNFMQYVNNAVFDDMGTVFSMLKTHYTTHGSWNRLEDPVAWAALLNRAAPVREDVRGHQAPPAFGGHGPPPGPFSPRGATPGRAGPFDTGEPGRPEGPFPPENPGNNLHQRLCLFDARKNQVTGPFVPDSKFTFRAVEMNGRTVGWLGLRTPPKFENPLGLEFLRQQAEAFILIAAAILVIALVISWALSRMLLVPVEALIKGTRALKSFDFDVEIPPRSNDELGLLARDFNQMARTIRQYEIMQKNWLSDISHELRTPISVLQSKLEALQDGIRRMTPDMLASLHTETKGLGELVNNLHLLSMADAKGLALDMDQVDVSALLARTLEGFKMRLAKKGITLEPPEPSSPCFILADAHHLSRLFANLIENTLRYTDSPGLLRITRALDGETVEFRFEDSAPGVPGENLDKIFDRLYRVDKSRSRALGGSGLGLSICRQIATDHKGRICAAPSDLGGLCIRLELPLKEK